MRKRQSSAVVLMGVAGSGKTTVGRALSRMFAVDFVDADSLHSPAAVAAMRRGRALTDLERDEWMRRVAEAIPPARPCIMACSALRRSHRDRLAALNGVRMVLLQVPEPELRRRLRQRDHFFPASLLDDQLHVFHPPEADEAVDVVDGARVVADVVDDVARLIGGDLRR